MASVAAPHVNWARQAVSDEMGQVDIAYVSIMVLVVMACMSVMFILVMSVVSYVRCAPITTLTTAVEGAGALTSVVPCNYDPLPTGQAVGLIFGAFATLIIALGGYMGLTRRRGTRGETIDAPPPAPA